MSDPDPIHELGPLLVANRGEIAVRVQRTAQALGLPTIAVFTAPDAAAPHVRAADLAIRIDSYLDVESLLGAAERAGARSVHPGYGFLSENAGFARAVRGAGLVWVGPPPDAIEVMGDKGRSKELAADAGVPVIPGTTGGDASEAEIRALAAEHGLPLMIKAVAGGGGKGMRVVTGKGELEGSIAAARREAEAAFGDGRLLAELYLERPRHIEIQVLADGHGNAIHLGERECSLQRRHQKVIEEAPSPAVDEELRGRMGRAAVDLARACSYEGAGTVELIVPSLEAGVGGSGGFYFLEMNTRLQVEHPVTEMVWGVDLVEQQLRVAAGEKLGIEGAGEGREPSGHAVEARLYAEDPAAGFLPATGTVRRWREPVGPGIRIDAGIAEGVTVGTDFDPMLAKLIAHGPDRATAIARLDRALAGLDLLGLSTNAAFSRALLADPEVRAGRLDTGLLERALDEIDHRPPGHLLAAGALALYLADTDGLGVRPGPWRRSFRGLGEVRIEDGRLTGAAGAERATVRWSGEAELLCELDGAARAYAAIVEGERVWITHGGHHLALEPVHRAVGDVDPRSGSLEAPMPGKVLAVEVAEGDEVEAGDVLLTLESMKMELQISAPVAGTVAGLSVGAGDQVAQGDPLAVVDPEGEE